MRMSRVGALLAIACVSVILLLFGVSPGASAAPRETLGPGPYYLSFAHSGKCVAIPNNSLNNVQLHQWNCFSTNSERWYLDLRLIDANGTSWYWIRSVHSNKCLNVYNNSPDREAPIIQYPCSDVSNEYFAVWYDSTVPYPYYWVQARSSYKVLNVSGGSNTDGAKLIQYDRRNTANEYVALSYGPP